MTAPNSQIGDAHLKLELQKQVDAEKNSFGKVMKKMETLLKTYEHGQAMDTKFKQLQAQKSEEATELIMQMHRENKNLSVEHLLKRHKLALGEIRRRLSLALDIAGRADGEVSTFEELAELKQVELPLLIRDLSNVDDIVNEVPGSYLDIVAKLDKTPREDLTSAEKELVLSEIRKIANMNKPPKPNEVRKNLGKYAGLAILSHMEPEERLNILRELLNEEKTIKIVVSSAASGYLTIEQGVELMKEMAQKNPAFAKNALKAIEVMDSDKFRNFKLQVERLQADAKKSLRRNFGKNYAGKILSLKGAFVWEVGRGWGIVTMLANTLASVDFTQIYKNPAEFAKQSAGLLTNPAFLMGATAVAASAEIISGGIGKGWLTQGLAKIMNDNSKEVAQVKVDKKRDFMRKALGDNSRAAELYFDNAEYIVKQFEKDPKSMKLQDVGIDYKSLDKKFTDKSLGGMSEEEYNELIPQIAASFYDEKVGLGAKTFRAQQKFINEARDAAGLNRF